MKILIVNKFLYPNGGSETYIFKIGEQLKKEGHEVQYFGMEHEGRIVGNKAESYTSSMDFHSGKLSKLLYPFRIIYSSEAAKKITLVLEDMKPDVVHLNNFNFHLTPSIIYAVRRWEKKSGHKVKLIFTAHDYQWICPNHTMKIPSNNELCYKCKGGRFGECSKNRCIHNSRLRSLLGSIEAILYYKLKTYSKVDAIIAPSKFLAEKLKDYPGLSEKIVTIHNFVDAPKVSYQKEKYVLFFGRYAEEKGVDLILECARRLPEVSFIFAGSGPLKDEIAKLPNIEDKGFMTGDALMELIGRARFSLYPARWYENCPFSVMESICYGTALVGANIGGIPELVRPGICGELFEPGDVEALYNIIKELWEDDEKIRRYSENTKDHGYLSLKEYTDKLLEIYRS